VNISINVNFVFSNSNLLGIIQFCLVYYSLGYLFHIAAGLGSAGSFAVDRIEDAIVQADEIDRRMLQFEGGLSITGIFIFNETYSQ
jgi:hypothetical protein